MNQKHSMSNREKTISKKHHCTKNNNNSKHNKNNNNSNNKRQLTRVNDKTSDHSNDIQSPSNDNQHNNISKHYDL